MGRGSTDLDSRDYDSYLAANKKEKELRERQVARRNANKGYEGWHFGIDTKPIFTKDKQDFQKALKERGLMMKDDVKRSLR
jgi:hypothetical protein